MSAPLFPVFESLRLAWPLVLVLLALPWLMALLTRDRSASDVGSVPGSLSIRLPFADRLPTISDPEYRRLPGRSHPGNGRSSMWSFLFWGAYGLLVLAAARPQWLAEIPTRVVSGRDVLLVLDVSASMRTSDLKAGKDTLTRIETAAGLGSRFLVRRPGDRAGLIVFGSRPYLYTPLTYDLAAVAAALEGAAVGLAGPETALGDAIGLAVKTLSGDPEVPAQSTQTARPAGKVAILISDGASNRSGLSPQQAAWLAAQRGVRVHSLGIGSEPDEATLRLIAEQGGGHYARATDAPAVAAFFDRVDAMEPAVQAAAGGVGIGAGGQLGVREWRDVYPLPLALAIVLLALAWARKMDWR